MVRVEQTEFWSDVSDASPSVGTAVFTRGSDAVYVDETSSLTEWFLDEDGPGASPDVTEDAEVVEMPADEPEVPAASMVEHPRATMARSTYANHTTPKFNMARFLTLTGSLD